MPSQPTSTETRLDNVLAYMTLAITTLNELSDSFGTPFLQAISSTTLSLVTQNVKQYKDECTLMMEDVQHLINAIIDLYLQSRGRDELPLATLHHLSKFVEVLHKIYVFVEAQQDGNMFKRLLRRHEMSQLLKECNAGLSQAFDAFKIENGIKKFRNIDNMKMKAQKQHDELMELIATLSDRTGSDPSFAHGSFASSYSSEPKIFHGRGTELQEIVDMVSKEAPKIAILGAGGMGKSTLAKAILHHSAVTAKYEHRFFIPCHSAATKIELAAIIGSYLSLKPGKDLTKPILRHLSEGPPSLLVLDNLETPWEPMESRADVEEFLSLLTDIDHLGLLITMRGTERPAKVRWSRPFLHPLKPLSLEAARQTFTDIADDVHNGNEIDKILHLTDNIPLAVTLIAHLVDYEGCPSVLARWETERTSLLSDGLDSRTCRAALLWTSLAYTADNCRLKSLGPIREYTQRVSPPSQSLVSPVCKYFHGLLQFYFEYDGVELSGVVGQITANLGNIHEVVWRTQDTTDVVRCTVALNSFRRMTGHGLSRLMERIPEILLGHPDPLLETLFIVETFGSYHRYHTNDLHKAMSYFEIALSAARSCGDPSRQCVALIQMALIDMCTSNYRGAQDRAQQVETLAKQSGNLLQEARALRIKALAHRALGDYKSITELFRTAKMLLGLCGLAESETAKIIRDNEAECHLEKSEYAEAQRIHVELFRGLSAEQNPHAYAFTLLNIAQIDVIIGTSESEVRTKLDTVKSIFSMKKYPMGVLMCDTIIADLELRIGNTVAAKTLFEKCVRLSWGKYSDAVSYCLERLGDMHRWRLTGSEIVWSFEWAVVFFAHGQKSEGKLAFHKALRYIGDALLAQGDEQTAFSLFTVALAGFTDMDVHRDRAECMLRLGYIARKTGDYGAALELWEAARPLFVRSLQGEQVVCVDVLLATIKKEILKEEERKLTQLAGICAPVGLGSIVYGFLCSWMK
ncbi:hypothetical protein B0H13DRAFT_2530078 [Mycena leptocephala]|nr:hypothetical protein B0H13DRAFT_2530078 [Mycena leptocephala]